MTAQIKLVTDGLRDQAVELLVRFFREEDFATAPSRIAEHFDLMRGDPSCWSAIAVDGGTAQAIVTVSTIRSVEWGLFGEIGDLYVLPESRRRGLARRLIEHAKDWCRARGCSAMAVTITAESQRRHGLRRFYARFGFEKTDRMSAAVLLDR